MQRSQTKSLQEIFDINKLLLSFDVYLKNNDDSKALWALYHYYENGWCGVKANKENSFICLKKAAEQGHAGATFKLIKFFSDSAEQNSIDLIQKYISDDHIKKCYSKIDEFNDGYFYNQDDYIALLEKIKDQTITTRSTNNTIRQRIPRSLQPFP